MEVIARSLPPSTTAARTLMPSTSTVVAVALSALLLYAYFSSDSRPTAPRERRRPRARQQPEQPDVRPLSQPRLEQQEHAANSPAQQVLQLEDYREDGLPVVSWFPSGYFKNSTEDNNCYIGSLLHIIRYVPQLRQMFKAPREEGSPLQELRRNILAILTDLDSGVGIKLHKSQQLQAALVGAGIIEKWVRWTALSIYFVLSWNISKVKV